MIADTAEAQKELDAFIRNSSDRRIIIKVTADGAGFKFNGREVTANQADGSVRYYANGAVEHHVAQMARAGEFRVWAEDETGGESYVPHALSKRARSEVIMAETARLFGGTYIPAGARGFADGAVSGALAPPVALGGPAPLIGGNVQFVSSGDPKADLDTLAFYLRYLDLGGRIDDW